MARPRQARRQPVADAVPRRQRVHHREERAAGVRPGARAARPRDHRERAARPHRSGDRPPARAARSRRAHLDGRFRHRLFLAQLPARLPVRQDQDRPLVRARSAQQPAHAGDRARHPRPRLRPRHESRRRGHRDAGRSRLPRGRGLQGRPGLPVQRSAAAERDPEAAGRSAGAATWPERSRACPSRDRATRACAARPSGSR